MRAAGETDPGRSVGQAAALRVAGEPALLEAAARAAGEPALLARPTPAGLVDLPGRRYARLDESFDRLADQQLMRAAGETDPGRAEGEAAARAAGEPALLARPTSAGLD